MVRPQCCRSTHAAYAAKEKATSEDEVGLRALEVRRSKGSGPSPTSEPHDIVLEGWSLSSVLKVFN